MLRKNKEVLSDEVFRTTRGTNLGKTLTFKRTLFLSCLVGGKREGLRHIEFLVHCSRPLFHEDVCINVSKIFNFCFKFTRLVARYDFVSFSRYKTHVLCSRYPSVLKTSDFVIL
jgi:hypothetical protein